MDHRLVSRRRQSAFGYHCSFGLGTGGRTGHHTRLRPIHSGRAKVLRVAGIRHPLGGIHPCKQGVQQNQKNQDLGKNIADRAGIALAWDVSGNSFSISSVEQSKENDCTFFTNLCNDYGLQVKVYSHKLVVYDREAYKKKVAVDTVDASEFISWDGGPSMSEVYTGGEYTYTNPQTSKKIVAKVGGGDKILKKSGKADSAADAERKIKALVSNANHGHIKLNFEMMGNAKWISTQCIQINGLGVLSGKYYLDSVSNKVDGSGGSTVSVEASMVE